MKQCSLDRTGPSYSWMVSSCGHLHKTWTRPSHSAFHHGGKAQESTSSTEELWTADDILGEEESVFSKMWPGRAAVLWCVFHTEECMVNTNQSRMSSSEEVGAWWCVWGELGVNVIKI